MAEIAAIASWVILLSLAVALWYAYICEDESPNFFILWGGTLLLAVVMVLGLAAIIAIPVLVYHLLT